MSWSDHDLTLDLAVVTLTYKILSGLFNARWEIHTAAVVLFILVLISLSTPLVMSLWAVLWAEETNTIQLVKVLYYKLPTMGKQLPTLPHRVRCLKCRCQRWEASVLQLHHCGAPKLKSKTPVHFNKLLYIRQVDNEIKIHTEDIHICLYFIASYAKLKSLYL